MLVSTPPPAGVGGNIPLPAVATMTKAAAARLGQAQPSSPVPPRDPSPRTGSPDMPLQRRRSHDDARLGTTTHVDPFEATRATSPKCRAKGSPPPSTGTDRHGATSPDRRGRPARRRASTMPCINKRSARELPLRLVVLPLAPETSETPASPPASAQRQAARKWRPRGVIKASRPPPPSEYVRFTPTGATFTSYEEYAEMTKRTREKIKAVGSTQLQQATASHQMRLSPLVATGPDV